MTGFPAEAEGIPVVIEIEGADETTANELRNIFDEDGELVAFAHAFGGVDVVSIITTLGKSTIDKLTGYFARKVTNPSKVRLRIGKNKLELDGLGAKDIDALFASPNFQKTVRLIAK